MEFAFPSFPTLLNFIVVVFMVLKFWKRLKTNGKTSTLPPGPWKLPVLGNMHQLLGSLPHHRLRDLAMKYGPFMHLHLGELPMIVVSSPEFAKEIMETHDITFASRPYTFVGHILSFNSSDIAFSPYGEYWRKLRKICVLEVLSMKRVQSFRPIREEAMSNLIHWITSKAGSPINLTDEIFSLTIIIISRATFGKEVEGKENVLPLIKQCVEAAGGFNIADFFPSIEGFLLWITGIKSHIEKLHREADQMLENIINEHEMRKPKSKIGKSEENEVLLDVLLKIQEEGDGEFHLTTTGIKAVLWDMFGAGSETSATSITWAMAELMKNPGVMKKAQAEVREVFNRRGKVDETGVDELKFLKLVIKESMRLHPPLALLVPRECRERCEIQGFDIPIKTRVIVNAWAIGRDPKYWKNPESFIPERFLESSIDYKGNSFKLLTFGAGRRICPGLSFGMASVELPIALLLYHFDWKLPEQIRHQGVSMTENFGITVRRKEDLYMIPIPYHPPSAARS